jgi:alpha-L-fucosidase
MNPSGAKRMAYEPTWGSLQAYTVPDWYLDAKFGIFIHWGIYSVPAFGNEWYPRNMYVAGRPEFEHHVETHGPQSQFGYKDFIPLFNAEKFDPDDWAQLFKQAGARYVVPVAEHHDGFAMYDCSLSEWCAAKMGPKRDILGELAQAVRQQGLVLGVSSHRAEHWWYFDGGTKFASDVQDPRCAGLYGPAVPSSPTPRSEAWRSKDWQPRPNALFLDDWLARCSELIDKYRPQLFWFDWWIEQVVFEPYLQKFAAYYYNRGLEWDLGVAINYKHQAFPDGTAVYDIERGQLAGINPQFWQTDTSLSKNSWGYVRNQVYKTAGDVIRDLVDIVSKNGCLLLNVGPRPDGTIPEPEREILLDVGRWLDVNGDAIYGTRPWKVYGEGPTQVREGYFTDTQRAPFTSQDIRFTVKGDTLYATVMGWPEQDEVVIKSLGTDARADTRAIEEIKMLGSSETLSWSQTEEGLVIKIPSRKPCAHAYVIKIRPDPSG